MDFDLTSIQQQLLEAARKVIAREIAPSANEMDRRGPLGRSDAQDLLRRLAPLGYVGGILPESAGGMGLDFLTYGLLLEELKRVWASAGGICSITTSAARTLSELGTDDQKKRFIPRLLSGESIGCVGITEPEAGSDVQGIRMTATRKGGRYILNGTKTWITNGSIADVCIVLARVVDGKKLLGPTRIIVDRNESPFEARNIPKMGLRACPLSELSFRDVTVPEGNLLGDVGDGLKTALRGLDLARANAAVGSVGVAQGALDIALSYAGERRQFGKPIGSYQLVQELLADMATLTSAARWMAYHALRCLDLGRPASKAAAMAKSFATEAAVKVTSDALQVHGAYGLAEEYRVERYYRDARCYTIPDGTTQIQKLVIGRELLGLKAFR